MMSTWRALAVVATAAALATSRGVDAFSSALSSGTATDTGVIRHGFSECVDNERTLYYYTDDEQKCTTSTTGKVLAKPPVHGLRCDVMCDKGYFLGANFTGETPTSGCEKCPQGKYSLGGGKLFSKRTKAWTNPLPIDIHSECVTRNLYTNEWQTNCHPWRATSDGVMVESGANGNILEQFEAARLFSSLRISATFVRNGTVTFKYKVSAEPPYDGLVFGIDDQTVMELVSRSDGWQEKIYQVTPGAHTFSWDYTKDFSGDEGDDKAYLKVIELVGTSYSDTYCHACGSDTTMSGGSLCAFCKEDEYAAPRSDSELDFACYACPKDTFAAKGSIGLESCVSRRPCSQDDVVEKFAPCVNGKRNESFSWGSPRTCELELPGAITLPKHKIDVPCDACEKGYRLTEDDTCERCPLGERLNGNGNCETCPAGHVVLNVANYGRGTTSGWSDWPEIFDVDAAKQNGWKLTRDGVVFSPETLRAGALSDMRRFVLPFNVTFAHTGVMEIMYVLENVPTFENDGVRAWLEIEVEDDTTTTTATGKKSQDSDTDGDASGDDDDDDDDDDDGGEGDTVVGGTKTNGGNVHVLHLSNGGTNGTASEGFDFNVTTPSHKQMRLVLRTTGAKAARMVQAKLFFLRFQGTQEGAGVTCGTCAPGFQAIHSSDFTGCKVCPAGTFAGTVKGITLCEKCPANTWSRDGATQCERCGVNTFSSGGAASCAPPTVLQVNSTASSATKLKYNIELMQSLVWGNLSSIGGDNIFDAVEAGASAWNAGFVETTAVTPAHVIEVDSATSMMTGLFRPVSSLWKKAMQGHIMDDLSSAEAETPYVVLLNVMNAKDAGGFFKQKTTRYGQVQCSVPAEWKVTSGGNAMAIHPAANGTGVTVHYTGGTPCKNGRAASTTLHYRCDLKAGTPDRPTRVARDVDNCHIEMEWRTSFACPICDASFFNEAKTSCSDGKQSISYAQSQPCYGGVSPNAVAVATCSDIVLDSKALYTAYAAISIVGFVILLLMGGIMVMHRKYRNAYNDFMYLKGKMPVNEVITSDGGKESTFEFTPKSTAIHSTSPNSLQGGSGGGRSLFSPEEEEHKDNDKNSNDNDNDPRLHSV